VFIIQLLTSGISLNLYPILSVDFCSKSTSGQAVGLLAGQVNEAVTT